MDYRQKHFSELTTTELYEILRTRAEIFVVEQQCAYQDLDGLDSEALHLWMEVEGRVVAYARVFMRDEEQGTAQIGRVVTIRRGEGMGLRLLQKAVDVCATELRARKIYMEAQVYAIEFYRKAGFEVVSPEFLEDGIPHVKMEKILNQIFSPI